MWLRVCAMSNEQKDKNPPAPGARIQHRITEKKPKIQAELIVTVIVVVAAKASASPTAAFERAMRCYSVAVTAPAAAAAASAVWVVGEQ